MLLTLSIFLFISSCSSQYAPKIEISGEEIKINIGDHYLVTQKDADINESGMLFGFQLISEMTSDAYFTAVMSFIPMTQAESLLETYPDFYRCGSEGAAEAQSYIIDTIIIAANSKVEKTIRKIAKLFALHEKHIIAKFEGFEITVQEYKIKKEGMKIPIPINQISSQIHYLINEIEYEERSF